MCRLCFPGKDFRLLYCLLLLVPFSLCAQTGNPAKATSALKIGIAGSEPFVFQDKKNFSGIAVEVWEQTAGLAGWGFQYVPFENIHDALDAMQNGELDMVVGPVSITAERVAKMKFSQPYYQSSLAILSRLEKPGAWSRIKPFFSFKLLIAISVFLTILAIVGTLTWLAERKKSPEQFPHDPVQGIGNGMWLAIVTMSTTGYGDRAPVTFWGRVIAGSWMVISIIFATSMVAGIASTLTLTGMGNSAFSTVEQLSGKKVATINGSSAEDFLEEYALKEVGVGTLEEAVERLKNKEVDAVIYDRPQLLYYLNKNKTGDLYISTAEYDKQGYGFAFPLDTKISHAANVFLLELSENRKIERILNYWLGKEEKALMSN